MSIQEIINIKDCNKGENHLYKEGIFWKAYQQSAYLFTREVKAFKISYLNHKIVFNDPTCGCAICGSRTDGMWLKRTLPLNPSVDVKLCTI